MASFLDFPAITATQDNQRKQLTATLGALLLEQVFANRNNVGTVWIGGPAVVQDRGLPIYAGSSMFVPPIPGSSLEQSSIYFFFEKSGDTVYMLGIKQ